MRYHNSRLLPYWMLRDRSFLTSKDMEFMNFFVELLILDPPDGQRCLIAQFQACRHHEKRDH